MSFSTCTFSKERNKEHAFVFNQICLVVSMLLDIGNSVPLISSVSISIYIIPIYISKITCKHKFQYIYIYLSVLK